jgi:hypothetical protein
MHAVLVLMTMKRLASKQTLFWEWETTAASRERKNFVNNFNGLEMWPSWLRDNAGGVWSHMVLWLWFDLHAFIEDLNLMVIVLEWVVMGRV